MGILGVGVDSVLISEISRYLEEDGESSSFICRTFTANEKKGAISRVDKAAYYASRFAAKEAVFKAIDHLLGEESFDFRIVETLHHSDGSPYINTSGALAQVLESAGVDTLLISVTTEGDYATAFVIAYAGQAR
jgi:phosphopantetheine--protein transferase-like protein